MAQKTSDQSVNVAVRVRKSRNNETVEDVLCSLFPVYALQSLGLIFMPYTRNCGTLCGRYREDFNMGIHKLFLRKLLVESLENISATEVIDKKSSDSWKYLVAVLVIAISLSVLIAIGAKCKILHRYLASYRHSRLSEGDGASQCDPASFEVGFSNQGNIPNSDMANGNLEYDDDGFIEDNYIQASERERAAREIEHWQEDDEDEDMEEFSIG
ncbi:hypothetical protein QTP86_015378 [Hemibagrus guttatus]|nr:hypothetical protein QTP86_015378 [Hemibagrus guttatus]